MSSGELEEFDKLVAYQKAVFKARAEEPVSGFVEPEVEKPKVDPTWTEEPGIKLLDAINSRAKKDLLVSFELSQAIRRKARFRSLAKHESRLLAAAMHKDKGLIDAINLDVNRVGTKTND